jgi:hypothetical protein
VRLWTKLFVMLAVMAGIQAYLGGGGGWIDETCFAVRVGLHNLVPGSDPNDPVLLTAAEQLAERTSARATTWELARQAAAGGRK